MTADSDGPSAPSGLDVGTDGVAGAVYKHIKSEVLAGSFSPGQRMSEALLSRRYGVSRSPIREATIRLEHDGLVERTGMLVRVRKRSSDEIIDIYRVRVFLESAIAADAATRRTEIDLLRMGSALTTESEIDQSDSNAMVLANRAFHEALAAAAHNVTLQDLQHRLTSQVATFQATTLSHPGRWAEGHREHGEILEAVRDRNPAVARALAEQHLTRARDLWLAGLAQPR